MAAETRRRRRVGRFRRWIYLVSTITHIPFVIALGGFVLAGVRFGYIIAAATAAVLVSLLRFRLSLVMDDRPISAVRRFFERLYYAEWSAALASVPLFLIALPVSLLLGDGVVHAGLGAYSFAVALALFAVFYRSRATRVRSITVEVEGLPRPFEGYRIVQLSDVHLGSLCPASQVDRWVAKANALNPDLVALTGDYITAGTRFHEAVADSLSRLRGKDGVAAVLGTHEHFGDAEPLSAALLERGVKLLRNENFAIEREGERLTIAGVDDVWTARADVARTLEGATHPIVALAHDPKLFPELAERDVALTLSGHTHWGQLGLPFFADRVNVATRVFRHSAGLYRQGRSTLYVHPGLGTTGPPVRLGVAPEITVFTLVGRSG